MVPNGDVKAEQSLSDALHDIPEITSIISYVDTVGAEIPKEYLDTDTLSKLVSDNYNRFVLSVEADYEGEATFDLVERIRKTADTYYPDTYYLAGEGVSTYDLMDTITADTLNQQIAYLEQAGGNSAQIAQLKASAEQLQGIVMLLQGNSAAINGMDAYLTQLSAGISEIVIGVNDLKTNYATIDAGINELVSQVKWLLVDTNQLKVGIDTLVTEYAKLDTGINQYTSGVAQVVAGYSEIVTGFDELLYGSNELKTGTDELYSKTGELLNGIVEFYDATGTLKDGTGELADGVAELICGIKELYDGTSELKDGTAEICEKTNGMDDKISDKIDEMIESMTGGSFAVVSFVSEKNINVEAVQFVIQTQAVKVNDIETVASVVKEELSFWQKILRLFGLY